MKRLVELMLFLCLLCSVGMAESGQCGDDVWWELDDQGVLTISGTGRMYNYSSTDRPPWLYLADSIESVVIGEEVSNLGSFSFYECWKIKYVDLGNITNIGSYAFYNCTGIETIVIPDGVDAISYACFSGCKYLNIIEIPSSVNRINREAFYGCRSLESIILPEGLTSVGIAAFSGCSSLQDLEIPETCTEFEDQAFWLIKGPVKTKTLTAYYKLKDNPAYVRCPVQYIGEISEVSGEFTCIDIDENTCIVDGYTGFLPDLCIPSLFDGKTVTGIKSEAFKDATYIETIVIPSTVRNIG